MIKYFYPDKDGNITFTKAELEKLLNDVYNEGRSDGEHYTRPYITNTNPFWQPMVYNSTPLTTNDNTVYCTECNSIGKTYLTSTTVEELESAIRVSNEV